MESVIPAGEFKARCLQLLDQVATTGAKLTITKDGKPVAQLVPFPNRRSLFGAMRGSVVASGDIVSGSGEHWSAEL